MTPTEIEALGDERRMEPALRCWLWTNFGWDIYDWEPDDLRF